MDFLAIVISIAPIIVGFLLAGFLFPIFIVLHEVGHFIAAKTCRIPVYAFTVGSGERVFGFNFLGFPWSFRRSVSEGEIVVPRLIPVSTSGWNSILILALSGPAVNFSFMVVAFLTVIFADHPLTKTFAVAVFFANYNLLRSADGDYELAKTARARDLEKLKSYHKQGEDAPPLFNLG